MDYLGIYLNDHLAGATAGLELARRSAGAQREPSAKETLRRLVGELAEDREALIRIMKSLDVPIRQYKVYAGWLAEKAGRLKLNGHLLTRSPLSDVQELEAMRLGIEGKDSSWRTLRALAERDDRLNQEELDELRARARRQAETVEDLRTKAAAEIFGA